MVRSDVVKKGTLGILKIMVSEHRHSQGVQWVHLHPPGWRKKNFQA